ncbi:hypothetical protein AB1Y20_012650 [Prymnesium parvum]|uniref:Oxidation resistance protein 1 n=1 Tax=Prymnesium parvum TaxID=97485 RepID=A0AB34IKW8_PRYPA
MSILLASGGPVDAPPTAAPARDDAPPSPRGATAHLPSPSVASASPSRAPPPPQTDNSPLPSFDGFNSLFSWLTLGRRGSRTSRSSRDGPSSPGASSRAMHWASSSSQGVPRLLDGRGGHIGSSVLSQLVLQQLSNAIPSRYACSDWRLLYSTAVHGISLNTMYMCTEGCGSCLLVLKDTTGQVFGGFCSEWRPPAKPAHFYGSGESFLFNVEAVCDLPPLLTGDEPPTEAVQVFRWTGENTYFMFSDREYLAMGSGGHFGLSLDSELLHGSSGRSATFGNPCLCRQPAELTGDDAEVGEFTCDVLEVWGMDHTMITHRKRQLRQRDVWLS